MQLRNWGTILKSLVNKSDCNSQYILLLENGNDMSEKDALQDIKQKKKIHHNTI
jgi:hypothetical protein